MNYRVWRTFVTADEL